MKTAIAAVLFLFAAGPARAQSIVAWTIGSPVPRIMLPWHPVPPLPLPGPRPLPRPAPPALPAPEASPVTLTGYRVEGTVEGQAANLTFHITFHNPTPRRLEGVLMIPIPADAVLSNFSMTVGGKETKGELLDAERAAQVYQSIVERQRDPGLLELVGERLLRARVFPIEPNGDITVRLVMTQLLRKSGDLVSLSVPVRSARFLAGTGGPASVRLSLRADRPLRSLYSPTPGVSITRDGERRAEVVYEPKADEARDLGLFYSLREDPLAAGLLAYREDGEDGAFLLSLSPRLTVDEKAVTPKDVVFILDRSGSMQGEKMDQARKALAYCISRLSPRDRFGIVDFATDAESFETSLLAATPENKARAERYVGRLEAAGGTNIQAALEEGSRLLASERGRVPMVFFLTDGLPTVGTTDLEALLRSARGRYASLKARVFSFGVGSDVNTLFLDKLAEANRGARDYVMAGEDIETKVSALYQKVAKPALTDVRVEWRGVEVEQVYPKPAADLFFGSELALAGRFRSGGKGTLVVTGEAAGRRQRFEFPVEFPAREVKHAFLPRLWAGLKVSHELDAIRLSGKADPEVVKEIARLAKKHGIVTPYTSYLVTEEGTSLPASAAAALRGVARLRGEAVRSGFGGAAASMSAQKASRMFDSSAVRGAAELSAFAEAEARDELKKEGRRAASLRAVGGKTFYLREDVWVDGDLELREDAESLETVRLACFSPEYFDLLARRPELARFLAVGSKLKLLDKDTVYEIE